MPPQPRSLFWIALSNLASKSHGDAGLTYSLGFGFVIVGVGLWKGSFAKAVISTLSLPGQKHLHRPCLPMIDTKCLPQAEDGAQW